MGGRGSSWKKNLQSTFKAWGHPGCLLLVGSLINRVTYIKSLVSQGLGFSFSVKLEGKKKYGWARFLYKSPSSNCYGSHRP